jgi:hypothetical protein
MKLLPLILLFSIFLTLSCKKDKFPDEFSVIGKWKENTADSVLTEIEFRRYNELRLKLRTDTIPASYKYLLDKANELEIFETTEFPNGRRTTHKITYNSKDEQITITGLYSATPQAETVFIRK